MKVQMRNERVTRATDVPAPYVATSRPSLPVPVLSPITSPEPLRLVVGG